MNKLNQEIELLSILAESSLSFLSFDREAKENVYYQLCDLIHDIKKYKVQVDEQN